MRLRSVAISVFALTLSGAVSGMAADAPAINPLTPVTAVLQTVSGVPDAG